MAMHEPISVIMIGCGKFSRYYHVPVLEADAAVSFAGIFDPSPSQEVRALAQRRAAPLVAAIEELPIPAGKTMAIITTPHALHAAHVALALQRHWHVLCDKPFVLKTSEARNLALDAQRLGLCNAVAFNRRFDRGCLSAREFIRAGRIGAVRYIQTVQLGYESKGWFLIPELGGGGPFTGRATHMADIVPWLLERRPSQVRARVRPGGSTRVDHGGFIDVRFGELECQMTAIEEGWHMWDEIRIFGDEGLIELRRPLQNPIGWELTLATERGEALERLAVDPNPGAATRNFLDALRGRVPVACSFADAIVATELVERALQSAAAAGAWFALTAHWH
jgi:phthalate 4,5-cis-dihydrodiol dehydrogenase